MTWTFLSNVWYYEKNGVSEQWIYTIWNLISNVLYSITYNGKRKGFFKSERGLKQGHSISPLFIIAAEAISRAINLFQNNYEFSGFSMHKKGLKTNHFSYGDDLIIFTSGKTKSLKIIKTILSNYERGSGQKVNTMKSCFLVSQKTS